MGHGQTLCTFSPKVHTFTSQEQMDKSHVLSNDCIRTVYAQITLYASLKIRESQGAQSEKKT